MFDAYDDLLSVDEACEALKIGHNTIYTLLNSGALKGFRCGRIWKIPRVALTENVSNSIELKKKTSFALYEVHPNSLIIKKSKNFKQTKFVR